MTTKLHVHSIYMYVYFQLCSKANVIIIADVVFDTNSDQCGQLLCMHRREEKRGNVSMFDMFYADMWYGIRAMGYWGMEYYLLQCRNETCGMKIRTGVCGMRYGVWGMGYYLL